jgi:hypothetical protein
MKPVTGSESRSPREHQAGASLPASMPDNAPYVNSVVFIRRLRLIGGARNRTATLVVAACVAVTEAANATCIGAARREPAEEPLVELR